MDNNEQTLQIKSETITKPKEEKKVRDSNIEILRIICMVLIIAHHFAVHSGFTFSIDRPIVFTSTDICFNYFLTQFLYLGGKIGVNCFVFITGFFSVTGKGVKAAKPIKQWLQAFFYAILIFAILTISGIEEFTVNNLLSSIFIVIFEQWWFFSAYFVLLLLSPFLNYLFKALPKRSYKIFLLISFIFWVVFPTFVWTKNYFTSNADFNNIIWFILLYATGAYFKLHGYDFKKKTGWYFGMSAICNGFIILSCFLFIILGQYNEFIYEHVTYMSEMQTIPMVLGSVFFFLGFLNLKVKPNKFINFVSSLTFGIYLIHDNQILRKHLWKEWIPSASKYSHSPYLILIAIGSIISVFIVGALIEIFRQKCIERLYAKPVEKLGAKIDSLIDKLFKEKDIQPLPSKEPTIENKNEVLINNQNSNQEIDIQETQKNEENK